MTWFHHRNCKPSKFTAREVLAQFAPEDRSKELLEGSTYAIDIRSRQAHTLKPTNGFLKMFPSEREGNVDTIRGNTLFVYDNVEDPFPKPAILHLLQQLHAGELRQTVETKEKIWKGKVTIIGASRPMPLPEILREEFLQVKLRTSTDHLRGVKTIEQMLHPQETPADFRRVIKKLFDASPSSPIPTLSAEQEQRIRDSFPDTAPQLAALAQGIAALQGQDQVEEQDIQDALRVGKDTKGDEE